MQKDTTPQPTPQSRTLVAPGAISLSEAQAFLKRCFAAAYPSMATADMLDNVEKVQTAEILAEDVDDRRLVAARSQENLVGMGVGVLRHGTLYAWGFYVDPALHRTGIGRRIMAALCADLADDAMVEVQVYTESHDAIAFYTALGFTTAGRIETELFPGHMCTLSIMAAKRSTLEI